MKRVDVAAPAKVNLLLRVLAREESGYHGIETLFQALELHDTVEVERRPEPAVSLEVTWAGPSEDLGPVEDNLAYRAAAGYRARAGLDDVPGVAVGLTKAIPAGAGLGGGSSDAAAVLRAMDRIHAGALGEAALMELAGSLGSDVPFFLGPSPLALGWGRGERLLGLPPLASRPVLVVIPPFRVSTGEAYRRLAEMRASPLGEPPSATPDARAGEASGGDEAGGHRGAGPSPGWTETVLPGAVPLTMDDVSSWSGVTARAGNDFEAVVLRDRPRARAILELLRSRGAAPALLSGSGSALFGVFPDGNRAEGAAKEIRSAVPGARVVRTGTLEGWPTVTTS